MHKYPDGTAFYYDGDNVNGYILDVNDKKPSLTAFFHNVSDRKHIICSAEHISYDKREYIIRTISANIIVRGLQDDALCMSFFLLYIITSSEKCNFDKIR